MDNFPSWKAILTGGPASIAWSFSCLYFAGYLKKHKGFKTGYTRKIFHFSTFTSAVAIQCIWSTPGVCLFGGMCSLVIFYAVYKGDGNILYEAMAREKDAPRRTHYIIMPYIATLTGGVAANILFGPAAITGYLVTGLGDAVGEPVGTRWGKHTYNVPSLTSVKAIRSYEGSLAVFIMCMAAVAIGISLHPDMILTSRTILLIPLIGILSALAEAVSPHGWDNATMQVVPSFLCYLAL